jgi:hypothetical protein
VVTLATVDQIQILSTQSKEYRLFSTLFVAIASLGLLMSALGM